MAAIGPVRCCSLPFANPAPFPTLLSITTLCLRPLRKSSTPTPSWVTPERPVWSVFLVVSLLISPPKIRTHFPPAVGNKRRNAPAQTLSHRRGQFAVNSNDGDRQAKVEENCDEKTSFAFCCGARHRRYRRRRTKASAGHDRLSIFG